MVTTLNLPALEIWRSYRGRADCENRIKELKADLSLDSVNVNDFYATEAILGLYNLMSLFRQAVLRGSVQHTLATQGICSRGVLAQRPRQAIIKLGGEPTTKSLV